MLRLRLVMLAGIAALALLGAAPAGSAVSGTITSQTAWSSVGTPAPGVTVSRKVITVSGYPGPRTLTRISWALGNSHVALDAAPVVPSGYGPAQHSFAEGLISSLGHATGALAGINGDTYCDRCARNGGDTLHGLLVHDRRIYATGSGPEIGYTPGGQMIMASARALPVRLALPNGSATIAVWNARSIPGHALHADQVAVFDKAGAAVSVPATSVAVVLAGSISVSGAASTVHAQFLNMLQMAVPYADPADQVMGSSAQAEWANAFRISQTGGMPVTAAMPVVGGVHTGATLTVPADGVVLVAPAGTTAAKGLAAAATRHKVGVPLDDSGWGAAQSIVDGKFQMVAGGSARTRYPGWHDSWPWYCQGPGRGCVRAAVAETHTRGWLIIEAGSRGTGLTMPDYARVLAQLGAQNAMGFDSNSHADLWRAGASPIDAFGYEPGSPEATMLRYR